MTTATTATTARTYPCIAEIWVEDRPATAGHVAWGHLERCPATATHRTVIEWDNGSRQTFRECDAHHAEGMALIESFGDTSPRLIKSVDI